MRIGRVQSDRGISYGIVGERSVRLVDGSPFEKSATTGLEISLDRVKILPPVDPSKIICVGLNYRDHAEELGMTPPEEPVLFMKPTTALVGQGDPIEYPSMSNRVDYEAELAIIVKKKAKFVVPGKAKDYILGYTCANDVTARDLQRTGEQWTLCKGFDTFCPLGPWIETELDPSGVKVEAFLNGERKQSSSTAEFIFSVDQLLSYISRVMTLLPGDVILTGTPVGVGPMRIGDEIEVRIEGVGSLINRVVG